MLVNRKASSLENVAVLLQKNIALLTAVQSTFLPPKQEKPIQVLTRINRVIVQIGEVSLFRWFTNGRQKWLQNHQMKYTPSRNRSSTRFKHLVCTYLVYAVTINLGSNHFFKEPAFKKCNQLRDVSYSSCHFGLQSVKEDMHLFMDK